MAKKRKNPFEEVGFPPLDGEMQAATRESAKDLGQLTPLMGEMSDQEGMMLFTVMGQMAEMGVTPEMYSAFYNTYHRLRPMMENMDSDARVAIGEKTEVLPGAENRTLLLRFQMKGVTKPPMWREVEVPADRTFKDLHDIIQAVMGLEDYHLWQFNRHAYDEGLVIGMTEDADPFGMGVDNATDNAATTPIEAFLHKEGDKLEYVYDFGDDWIFTVSVKKVLDKHSDHPVCTAYKSELNAMEDTGGPWSYERMRADLAGWSKLTKKKRQVAAEESGFDDAEEYHEMLEDSVFNMDNVNTWLKAL